mmetsp:Transcript_7413/g.13377  ORF Transcript_7413/g.13377 Transcript_7413/m.13377 type:complete len:140 (-) Transcript_7413:103-522(-)
MVLHNERNLYSGLEKNGGKLYYVQRKNSLHNRACTELGALLLDQDLNLPCSSRAPSRDAIMISVLFEILCVFLCREMGMNELNSYLVILLGQTCSIQIPLLMLCLLFVCDFVQSSEKAFRLSADPVAASLPLDCRKLFQ